MAFEIILNFLIYSIKLFLYSERGVLDIIPAYEMYTIKLTSVRPSGGLSTRKEENGLKYKCIETLKILLFLKKKIRCPNFNIYF